MPSGVGGRPGSAVVTTVWCSAITRPNPVGKRARSSKSRSLKVFSTRIGPAAVTTEPIAFLDESRKPIRDPATGRVDDRGLRHYVVAAAVVIGGDSPNIRRQLERIKAEIGYPLHYQDLSTARRVEALEAIDGIDGWDGYLFETARPLSDAGHSEHHVRARLVAEALTYLSSQGVVEAVLETRAGTNWRFLPLDDKDHDVVRRLQRQETVPDSFRIRHDDKTGLTEYLDEMVRFQDPRMESGSG